MLGQVLVMSVSELLADADSPPTKVRPLTVAVQVV